MTRVFLVLATLALSGCLPVGGDGILNYKGRVTDPKGKPFAQCRVELFHGEYGLGSRQVSGNFEISETGPPGGGTYVVDVICEDAKSHFRSSPVKIGGEQITDIGHIVLERKD